MDLAEIAAFLLRHDFRPSRRSALQDGASVYEYQAPGSDLRLVCEVSLDGSWATLKAADAVLMLPSAALMQHPDFRMLMEAVMIVGDLALKVSSETFLKGIQEAFEKRGKG